MEPYKCQKLFLCFMSFIYMMAFSSLYYQIPGLYGDNGLTPARSMLRCNSKNVTECAFFSELPTALHLASYFKLTPLQGMEVLCLLGILLAILSFLFNMFRDTFIYLILWFFYFSCFQVGQTFLWFQWDTLLLECGFLAFIVAPCKVLRTKTTRWMPHDNVTLFLVRWLAFRLMFASGIVKLTSECPTWWGLTALNHHFETQCLPIAAAWYAHQLPEWFLRLSVVGTYVIEIIIPPLFLSPFVHLRKFAFWSQIFFMITIIITGNYNFFNLLTCVLCLPILVDSRNSSISTFAVQRRFPRIYATVKWFMIFLIYYFIVYLTVKWFSLRIVGMTVQSKIAFSKPQFYEMLSWVMPKIIFLACACFIMEIFTALWRCIIDFRHTSIFTKLWVLMQCIFVCTVCIVMFTISLVPISHLDDNTYKNLWPDVKLFHQESDRYQLTHSYGLFRSMTGVDGRPEVIVEGAESFDGPWKEYEFMYKPGSLDRKPHFISPHQARLDWQMWFAALGTYQHNPWFISLVYKMLKNETQVLKMLEKNPFPHKPPTYVRAQLYHYYFTSYYPESENYHAKNWWYRKFQHEYMPPISIENGKNIVDFLRDKGLLIEKPLRPAKSKTTRFLRTVRSYAEMLKPHEFVQQLCLTVPLFINPKKFTLVKCMLLAILLFQVTGSWVNYFGIPKV